MTKETLDKATTLDAQIKITGSVFGVLDAAVTELALSLNTPSARELVHITTHVTKGSIAVDRNDLYAFLEGQRDKVKQTYDRMKDEFSKL